MTREAAQARAGPPRRGLDGAEAASRLAAEGFNELPQDRRPTAWRTVWRTCTEPMFLLLVAAGALYVALGDLREALLLLFAVTVVMTITIVQERRTERVLEALRDMTSPRALVIRDGVQQRIPGREVVRGDLLLLAEGDRVPADAVMLSGGAVEVDESLLTGEAVAVTKRPWDGREDFTTPGGDGLPFLYAGTVLVRGQAVAESRRVGAATELGRIGAALREVRVERTPLQQEIARLVGLFAPAALLLCAAIVLILGFARGDWTGGMQAGITAAMSLLPEEFPVVLTVFLALGAWRLSRHRVLTRQVAVIEALGAATVLCVDKTGTLTENRMGVAALALPDGAVFDVAGDRAGALPEAFHRLLEFGILASAVNPFDPMEQAFRALGDRYLHGTEHLHETWQLAHEYAVAPGMLAMTHVWRTLEHSHYVVAAKGAPEAILDLCHAPAARIDAVRMHVDALAARGLRVLAVACGTHRGAQWPDRQHDFDYEFLGLIGLEDPLRPGVAEAVRECREAGIRLAMITGDHPSTARAIARQLALEHADDVLTGDELRALDAEERRRRIAAATVFARVMPEQKLSLVQAFIASGEVVAMTGDGVNDAPALRAAHIGIAMGARGTDVAREAASLVLTDDDFGSIVHAVRVGRRIFDNLRKVTSYILAVHVPIAVIALLPLLCGWPLVLFPVHVVFLQLVIDPACSLVFELEGEEPGLMRRPPRRRTQPLVAASTLRGALLQGLCATLAVVGVYALALERYPAEAARTLGFTTLVATNLALIVLNRSRRRGWLANLVAPNPALRVVLLAAVAGYACALALPWLRGLFLFAWPGGPALACAVVAGVLAVAVLDPFTREGPPRPAAAP
jgi:Ca2+-transporting ATPase